MNKKILILIIILGIVIYRFFYVDATKIVEKMPNEVLEAIKGQELKDGPVAYKIEEKKDTLRFYLYDYSTTNESNMRKITISIYKLSANGNITSRDTEVHYSTKKEARAAYTKDKKDHKDVYFDKNVVVENNVDLYLDKVIPKETLIESLKETYSKLVDITD